jgi:hypothetical protein
MYRLARTAVTENLWRILVGCAAFAALWNLLLCHRPVDILSSGVAAWWTALCAVGVVNVCGWHRSASVLARRKATADPTGYTSQRWQLLLAAVFVLGCGFRSLFPRADVQRIGLIDSWLSSVLVGRSVATLAELCFMAQWALLLHTAAKDAGIRFAVALSWLVVPLILVAEVCSWYAVLTTCYLGNVLEESIWALTASLLVVGCLSVWSGCRAARRPFLAAALALGVVYVLFMCLVDVPMYVSRWRADEVSGRTYLALGQGLQDAWSRRVVTFSWEEWRTEIPWMTLYFSVCVWWSLALIHAPRLEPHRRIREQSCDSDPALKGRDDRQVYAPGLGSSALGVAGD